MKTRFPKRRRGGFTLIELLVAMAITALIVTVLVSITAIATDTWTRSRTELRAARQAKTMVDAMAKDFESMVTRRNNPYEWLVAKRPDTLPGSGSTKSPNAAELVFFTAPTDRYDGNLGDDASKGDVCGVGYLLEFKDPIEGDGGDFSTFVLNRLVVDPDDTFTDLLAKPSPPDVLGLYDLFLKEGSAYRTKLKETENFVCENVYQFTVVFHVEWTDTTTTPPTTKVSQVTVGENGVSKFSFKGTGIEIDGPTPSGVSEEQLKAGRMIGVEISLTVLSDAAITRIRKVGPPTGTGQPAKFISSNSHNYSKFIRLSSL
jgi:prepilin-type N-terminal cleavage/methylation domain-containing protein